MLEMWMNDKKIAYEKHGKGTPIIFIHPPGMGRMVFREQKQLCDDFQIITMDLSGHGDSDTRTEKVSVPMYVEEVRQLLNELEIEEAVICGYSAGGIIAQQFAFTYPKRTKALILSGGFPMVSTAVLKMEHVSGIKLLPKRSYFLANVISTSHTKDPFFREQLKEHMNKANPSVWKQFYKISYQYDGRVHLPSLQCPFLLIYGSRSDYINKYISIYQKYVQDVQYHIVPRVTHQVPTRRWQEFNEMVKAFVSRL
ncbi:alpha/beta fold hydrolase [Priestia abyssalis]|uniref:alpha/beta fold hydrolase n=1 Tax=Priestia abyssalis TaxID=1221450 RepID=UPI000994A3DD|nr:alpha/beta hydrolase [Priestia abyssalis]